MFASNVSFGFTAARTIHWWAECGVLRPRSGRPGSLRVERLGRCACRGQAAADLRRLVPIPDCARGAVVSWQAIEHVFAHSRAQSARTQAVALVLAKHHNERTGDGWPSLPRIARLARTSVPSVRRAIAELVAVGDLEVTRGGGHRSNRYVLRLHSETLDPFQTDRSQVDTGNSLIPPRPQLDTPEVSGCNPSDIRLAPEQKRKKESRHKRKAAAPPLTTASVPGLNALSDESVLCGVVETDDLRLVNTYARLWADTHQAPPHIDYSRDRGIMQALLRQHSADIIAAALGAYFAVSDTWLIKNKHPLTTFRGQFNRYQVTVGPSARLSRLSPAGASTAAALDGWLAAQASMDDV